MKKGDRIQKINAEPGDAHGNGEKGTIAEVFDTKQMLIESGKTPEEAEKIIMEFVEKTGSKKESILIMCSVFWDDLPQLPVMVSGSKIELVPG